MPDESGAPTGRIRGGLSRLWESAVDAALAALWVAVIGVVVTGAIALWAYLSGQWGRPWVYVLFGLVAGWGTFVIAFLLLLSLRARRMRALERIERAKYITGDIGILDAQLNIETALTEITRIMTSMTKGNVLMGKRLPRHTRNLAAAGTTRRRHAVAAAAAKDIHRTARYFERSIGEFEEGAAIFEDGMTRIATKLDLSRPENRAGTEALGVLVTTIRSVLVSTDGYEKAVSGTRGVTQELNGAVDRLVAVLGRTTAAIKKTEAGCVAVLGGKV